MLTLLFAGVAWPQVSPGWRFWDITDGMAESYTSSVVGTSHGVWFKHGHTAMNLLDGNQFILSTHPHAVGQFRGTRDGISGSGRALGSSATAPVPGIAIPYRK